jgi:chromosome segregation ATPase
LVEIWGRHKQAEATIAAMGADLQAREAQIAEMDKRLADERDDEPMLFGKDDWSGRVAALDAKLTELRHAEAQLLGALNQLKFDLSSLSVQLQAEQAQIELCDRWMADARAKQDKVEKALWDLGARLGATRPSRATTLAEAHLATSRIQERRAEIAARLDRARAEARRIKEETVRLLTRQKQIDVERQHARAMVESAEVAATQGRDEAARQLAAQRKAAVEQHVNEVLGGLEASLSSAETIFIEPAREALRKANEGGQAVSAAVAACAEELGPIVEELHRDLDPELLAQDATLSQIQREFCDAAPSACRAAWGSA